MNRVTTTGSTGAEVVYGSTILDLIYGDAGTDTLWGSYGADGAADALDRRRRQRHLLRLRDERRRHRDQCRSPATGGVDLVYSFSNHTLSANVEHLTLFGNNAALNSATGNNGDNALNAMQYVGGSGINFVDNVGNDIVFASYYADTISTGHRQRHAVGLVGRRRRGRRDVRRRRRRHLLRAGGARHRHRDQRRHGGRARSTRSTPRST